MASLAGTGVVAVVNDIVSCWASVVHSVQRSGSLKAVLSVIIDISWDNVHYPVGGTDKGVTICWQSGEKT